MLDMEYTKAVKYANEMIAIPAATDDAKEEAAAFLEKRVPQRKK